MRHETKQRGSAFEGRLIIQIPHEHVKFFGHSTALIVQRPIGVPWHLPIRRALSLVVCLLGPSELKDVTFL